MRFSFGCAQSLFALAILGGRIAAAASVPCPTYKPGSQVVTINEDFSGVSEGYFILPFRGQELVLHIEVLPTDSKETQLNLVRINGVPLGNGFGSPKVPRTTINAPLLPKLKIEGAETENVTNLLVKNAFEVKKGSWVEADIAAEIGKDCSRGTADCVNVLHLAVLATDEKPQEKCGAKGQRVKVGSTYASGLVDLSFTAKEGEKPSLRKVKKVGMSPAGDRWALTHPKVAENEKFVHKLGRMAFAFDAPEYFSSLSEKLKDGIDRSRHKFMVNFIPVDPFHVMAGYIWSYSYRYTFGEAFTRKQSVFSTVIANPEYPSYLVQEPTAIDNTDLSLAHTQGLYTVPEENERSDVFYSTKLRKAVSEDFDDGKTRTEKDLIGYMVQEVNITKIVPKGVKNPADQEWTPPYTPYGWNFLTHRKVYDGEWGNAQATDEPYIVMIKPHPNPLLPPRPKAPAAATAQFSIDDAVKYAEKAYVFVRDYALPALIVGVLTLVFFYGFKVGPWALGWTWRRLKGQSAYEEGEVESSSEDEDGKGEYEVGSTEGVMLDYLVAVDDSKNRLRTDGGRRRAVGGQK